jgi:DNA-binding NarL/FixJ family response regulator
MMPHSHEMKVYVVDDDPNLVASVTRSLSRANRGWRVSGNTNPITAIEEIVNDRMDIVIVDFNMPHMNGIELANIIKLSVPSVDLILLSGELTIQRLAEFKNSVQGIKVFSKPVSASALENGIRDIAERRRLRKKRSRGDKLVQVFEADSLLIDVNRNVIRPRENLNSLLDGETLFLSRERKLNLCSPTESEKFEAVLRSMSESFSPEISAYPLRNKERVITGALIIFSRLNSDAGALQFKIFLRSFSRRIEIDTTTIAEMFNLGQREAELASLFLQNYDLNEAAVKMGITLHSARTYTKRIYKKLGVRGLTDLVVMLLRSPIGYA